MSIMSKLTKNINTKETNRECFEMAVFVSLFPFPKNTLSITFCVVISKKIWTTHTVQVEDPKLLRIWIFVTAYGPRMAAKFTTLGKHILEFFQDSDPWSQFHEATYLVGMSFTTRPTKKVNFGLKQACLISLTLTFRVNVRSPRKH